MHRALQQQGPQPSADEGQRLRAQLVAAAGQGRALPPDVQAYIQQLQAQQAHQLHQHQVLYLLQSFVMSALLKLYKCLWNVPGPPAAPAPGARSVEPLS